MRLYLLFFLSVFFANCFGQTVAFPGAEGYGKVATGGRGGKVLKVTNLDDVNRAGAAVAGSFRAAIEQSNGQPVTIVFEVSGIIELKSELKAKVKNLTIAGQTAPGDGICIKGNSVVLAGENIIIRYMRFRPGDESNQQVTPLNMENSKNVIIDHCSMSWAVEENMGFYDNKYTTVQWCILSEGLRNSVHSKGARGYGSQWGGQYASYHHNLLAHNYSRSPRVNGSRAHDTLALVDYRNNVIYNWGSAGAVYGGEEEIPGGDCKINLVNNYYKRGASTSGNSFAAPDRASEGNERTGYAEWYIAGNIMEGNPNGVNEDNWKGVNASDVGGAENIRVDVEHEVSAITTESATDALNSVIEGVGAVLPKRDAVDGRIIAELKGDQEPKGDGIIDSQSEVGGWPEYVALEALPDKDGDGMPDQYENENNLNAEDASDGALIGTDGYSNLENYINSLTGVHGIGEITNTAQDENAMFYPNPSKGVLRLKAPYSDTRIEVFSLSGKLLLTTSPKNSYLDLSSLSKGTYIIHGYSTSGAIFDKRIVLE